MRRTVAAVSLVALGVLAGGSAPPLQASPLRAQKDAPTLSVITANFDEGAKATYYTVKFTTPGSATAVSKPTFDWSLTPPPDDPGCKRFSALPGRTGESVWYHSTDDGCTHLSPMHNGTISLKVTVVLSNDNRAWVCNASYFGTATGVGTDSGPCTIEAPALVAVARPPINEKEQWRIVADLFDECAETEGAIAAVATLAALPTGGVSAVPAAIAGGGAALCVGLARVAKRKVEDPPDRNFHVVASAKAAVVPQITYGATMPYTVSYAFNALSDNVTATEGYTNAFVTAINRASGAHAAHDAKAQSEQELAAATDAQAIAALDDERATLRSDLAGVLATAGVKTLTFTSAQLAKARSQIVAKGFPKSVLTSFSQAKFPSSLVAQLRAQVKAGKPSAASFPGDLTSAAAIAADRQDAAVMRAYVAFAKK